MVKQKLLQNLQAALKKIGIEDIEIDLEHPANSDFGDYATSVALKLAKKIVKGNFLNNINWFFQNINKENFYQYETSYPIGKLGKIITDLIKVKEKKVWLKTITFAKIRGWRKKEGFEGHPEITHSHFWAIPYVLAYPQHIIEDKTEKSRYLLVGKLEKHFALVIEINLSTEKNWLVSAFITRERYLKKKESECLEHKKKGKPAGTAVSPILAPKVDQRSLQSGGSRFSTLQDTRLFYTKISKICQEDILLYEEKKSPMEWADEIAKNFPKDEAIEKIEIVKPGFINFFLAKTYLIQVAQKIAKEKENYGQQPKKDFKILLEFGQPNTHKTPHIGHLFSYIYGESLAKILERNGNTVYRINYQGDIGPHVAKCLYKIKSFRLKTLKEKVDFLQKCYQEGAKMYEKDDNAKKDIDEINIQIYQEHPSISNLWQETRQWSLDFYKEFEKKLGIKYDRCYFESETGPIGKEIISRNLGKIFEKSEGAIIFKGEKYGLHTRVFINQYGNPTYEAKDIGLISQKMKDFDFDLSIVTTANEQNEYWKVVIAASELLYPQLVGKLKHIGFGMVNLTSGKMSSRTGNIVDPFTLLDVIEKSIQESFNTVDRNLAEKIALAAIKYSFLNSDYKRNIIFDLEKSIAKEGNSGPYLLYTYVRTQSVLKKSIPSTRDDDRRLNESSEFQQEELGLLRLFYRFPEVVEEAAKQFAPNLIANYLYQLASGYNLFYQKCPILKTGEKVRNFRLLLTKATGQIIKNGLYLLGIETVNKM